jgi:transcriptional regulator of NAD metabolism
MAEFKVYKKLSIEDRLEIYQKLQTQELELYVQLMDGHFQKIVYRNERETEAAVACTKCGVYFSAGSKGAIR